MLLRYFYPRPPRGGRPLTYNEDNVPYNFYPRPPRGGRPVAVICPGFLIAISIHALREEGDLMGQNDSTFWAISIHALREEGDTSALGSATFSSAISIHALREEGDRLYG